MRIWAFNVEKVFAAKMKDHIDVIIASAQLQHEQLSI